MQYPLGTKPPSINNNFLVIVIVYLTIGHSDKVCIVHHLDPGSAPQNFTAVASGRTSAWFSWEPPSVDDHNGVISYYLLRLVDDSFNLTDVTINTTNRSYTIDTLEEYIRYSCQVAAGTAAGIGPFTSPTLITTQQDGEDEVLILNYWLELCLCIDYCNFIFIFPAA